MRMLPIRLHMSSPLRLFLALGSAISMSLGAAGAQNGPAPIVSSIQGNYVGVAVGIVPDFQGSDDGSFGIAPVMRLELGNRRNVELLGNTLSVNLSTSDHFSFGPAALYRPGRDSGVDNPVIAQARKIDDAVELGAYASYNWFINNNFRNRFVLAGNFLHDVSGTHNGYVATVAARYWDDLAEWIDLGLDISARFVSDDYSQTYFGVDTANSLATGLPVFSADGGLGGLRVTPSLFFHLSPHWHVGAGLRWERLTGSAADSPIVLQEGSKNQFYAGIGIAYSWGEKVNYRR